MRSESSALHRGDSSRTQSSWKGQWCGPKTLSHYRNLKMCLFPIYSQGSVESYHLASMTFHGTSDVVVVWIWSQHWSLLWGVPSSSGVPIGTILLSYRIICLHAGLWHILNESCLYHLLPRFVSWGFSLSYFSHSLCYSLACRADTVSIDRMVDGKKNRSFQYLQT